MGSENKTLSEVTSSGLSPQDPFTILALETAYFSVSSGTVHNIPFLEIPYIYIHRL